MGNNPANRQKASGQNQLLVGFQNVPPILKKETIDSMLRKFNSTGAVPPSNIHKHPLKFKVHHLRYSHKEGIIFHLRQLLESMRKKKKMDSVSTSKLMKFVENQSLIFQRQRHQDCHQFYIWLMNSINDQLKGKEKDKVTPLEEEFFSKRVTRTQCSVCKNISQREEEEVDMSFILPEPNVSLNYCIGNYSKPQKLSGRDKFKCDKCETLVDAAKWSVIKTLPNFLSIHLRRFKYDENKKGITKLNWQIPFPFKLKIRTNYGEDTKEGLYKLVGVVVHLGTGENYGHYMSYIRIGQKWFVFNDDEISQTEDYLLQSLWGYKGLSKCAYMLFYSI